MILQAQLNSCPIEYAVRTRTIRQSASESYLLNEVSVENNLDFSLAIGFPVIHPIDYLIRNRSDFLVTDLAPDIDNCENFDVGAAPACSPHEIDPAHTLAFTQLSQGKHNPVFDIVRH
jgi:hypothetical protein